MSARPMATRDDDEDLDELERYRRATEDALQLLDWSIGYLYGIRKTKEAHQLSEGRRTIRQSVLRRSAEETPAEADGQPKRRRRESA